MVCSGTLHQRFAAASFANLEPIPTAVGGAAAWECAAAFLRAAGVQAGLPVSLETRSVCETCICLVLTVTEGIFSVRWFALL